MLRVLLLSLLFFSSTLATIGSPKLTTILGSLPGLFIDQSKIGIPCQSTDQCDYPFLVCENAPANADDPKGICLHKRLFPLTTLEIQGMIVIVITSMLAIAAGLGGGSLFVPLMMIFFGMNAHEAIPLSNALTFANSVVKYIKSFNEKHPDIPHKPIVDFNVAILFNPCMMLGSFIGVILQVTLPGIVSLFLLLGTLIAACFTGVKSAISRWNKETLAQNAMKIFTQSLLPKDGNGAIQMDHLGVPGNIKENRHEHYNDDLDEKENDKRLEAIERISQTEADKFPMEKMKLVILSFLVTVFVPILLGGKAMQSFLGITLCSPIYWFGSLLYLFAVTYLWYKAFNMCLEEENQKKQVVGGWPFNEAVRWEKGKIIFMSIYMTIVGMFSAIVGVGGGIYIVPTLTEQGYPSTVVSATSLFLVFWAKLASTIQFALNGSLLFDYTVALCLLCCIGSYFSLTGLGVLVKKLKRQSMIGMFFAIFVLIAGIITFYKIANMLFEDQNGFNIWAVDNYCERESGKAQYME